MQDHRVETHRVITVTQDANGRLAVVTKGDANDGADPWVATLEGDTVWQTQAVIPTSARGSAPCAPRWCRAASSGVRSAPSS